MFEIGDETTNDADAYDIAAESDDTDDEMPWGQKDEDSSTHPGSVGDDTYPLSSSPGLDRRDDAYENQAAHRMVSYRQQLAQFDRVDDTAPSHGIDGGPVTPSRGTADGVSTAATTPSRARASSTASSVTQVLLRSHVNLTLGVRSDASITSSYGLSSTDSLRGGLKSKVLRRLGSQAKQAVENIKSTSMAEYIIELRGPASSDVRRLVEEGEIAVYKLPKVSGDSKNPKLGPLCDEGDVIFRRPLSEMLDAGLKDLGRRDTVSFRYVAKQYLVEVAHHTTTGTGVGRSGRSGDVLAKSVSMLDANHSSDGGSGSLEGSVMHLRASDSAVLPLAVREIAGEDQLATSASVSPPPAAASVAKDKKDGSNVLYRRLKLYLPPQPCFGSIGLSLHFTAAHLSTKGKKGKHHTEVHHDPLSTSGERKSAVPPSDADRNSVKFNFLDIRFDSSSTRDRWWDLLKSMLGTQLLQRVRDGSEDEAETRRVNAQTAIDTVVGHRPPVEKFVEYFRSDLEEPADVRKDGAVAVRNTMVPPDGGVLEVVFGPLHRKPRKLSIDTMQTRGPDGNQIVRNGTAVNEPHLVIGPCNLRQRLRMVPSHAFPLRTLTVCAQDDQWGNTFYLERRDAASVKLSLSNAHSRKVLVERPITKPEKQQLVEVTSITNASSPRATPSPSLLQTPTTAVPPPMSLDGLHDPVTGDAPDDSLSDRRDVALSPAAGGTNTPSSPPGGAADNDAPYLRIELSTRSFVQRLKWMQWFAKVLGKPVVYVHDSTRDTSGPLQDTDDVDAVEAGGAVTLVEGEDGTITRVVHKRPTFSWLYARPTEPASLSAAALHRKASAFQHRSFSRQHTSKSISMTPSARGSGQSSSTTSPTDGAADHNDGDSTAAAAASPPPAAVRLSEPSIDVVEHGGISPPPNASAMVPPAAVPSPSDSAPDNAAAPRAAGLAPQSGSGLVRRVSSVAQVASETPRTTNAESATLVPALVATAPVTATATADAAWASVERHIRAATITGVVEAHEEPTTRRTTRMGGGNGDVSSKSIPQELLSARPPHDDHPAPPAFMDDSIEGAQLVVGCDLVWVRKPPSEENSVVALWSSCRLCILQTPHSTLSPVDVYDSIELRDAFDVYGCTVGFDACLSADWITRARVVVKPILMVNEEQQYGNALDRSQSSRSHLNDWTALLDAIGATDDDGDLQLDGDAAPPPAALTELPVLELYFDSHPTAHSRALDWYMKHHEEQADDGLGSMMSDGGSWLRVAMMEACAFHRPLELCMLAPTSVSAPLQSQGELDASLQWALDVARAVLPFLPEVTVIDECCA
jgi:hypothetical protein